MKSHSIKCNIDSCKLGIDKRSAPTFGGKHMHCNKSIMKKKCGKFYNLYKNSDLY